MVTSPDGGEYIIKRFRMIVAFKDSPAMVASYNTNQFSEQMLKILYRVRSGDRIIF
ncbi:hypothetical protein OAD66_02380 [Bacteroidia bacterium]|nr:hypothetical protein [Bacteroidia bacterium]